MRQGGKSSTTTKSAQEQFRTPDKPPFPGCSTTSKAQRDISTTKRQSGTPLSSASTSKIWRRSLLSGEQPTLTQIDFVTPRSQNPESNDDDLDYIDDAPHNETPVSRQVIELDDSSGGDTIYKTNAHSRLRRNAGATDGQNAECQPSRLRRSLGQPNFNEKRPRGRKSTDSVASNKKRTDKSRKDKTLTQMDYVRRYLKIEPDDEVKLEYTYVTPKRNQSKKITRKNSRDLGIASFNNATISSSSKKRKLQDNDEEQDSKVEVIPPQRQGKQLLKEEPKTPQKPRRSEIPSSQSPESPGVAFISSSQFRRATRSPVNLDDTKMFNKGIKEESPKQMSVVENTLPQPIVPESSLSFELGDSEEVPLGAKATQVKPATKASDSALEFVRQHGLNKPPPSTERTVVYETDAEPDFSDDERSIVSGPHLEVMQAYAENQVVTNDEAENDSQPLPSPIINSSSDGEPSFVHAETNLSSDASICYQRRNPDTQFPAEPVPTLSTQKLAELFPQESSLQQTPTGTSRIKPSLLRNQTLLDQFLPTQTQSQAQDLDKDSTEIVLESSPVARHQNYTGVSDPMLPVHPTYGVVQVESSQPADRLKKHADQIQNSGPKGLLSRSQLLTSSVMESVPVPGFWMGSQDSVGEPYSLPDT